MILDLGSKIGHSFTESLSFFLLLDLCLISGLNILELAMRHSTVTSLGLIHMSITEAKVRTAVVAAKWNKARETEFIDVQRNQTKQLCDGIIWESSSDMEKRLCRRCENKAISGQ